MHTQGNGQTRIVVYGIDVDTDVLVPLSVNQNAINVNIFPSSLWNAYGSIDIGGAVSSLTTTIPSGKVPGLTNLQLSSNALSAATTIQIVSGGINVIWEIDIPITGFAQPIPFEFLTPLAALAPDAALGIKLGTTIATGNIRFNAQGNFGSYTLS